MAEETAAYLETVVGERAHLIGWSDGAVVALLVAQYRPELVERIVLIGKYYNSSGRVSGTDLERFLRTDEGRDYLRRGYETVSPDGPEHFPVIYDKTMKMIDSEPELDLSTFASVTAPTLVLQADRDVVTLEHGAAVATALGNGRLAVLPGTHSLPVELPDVVNPLLVSFLQQSTPASP
jgi:pimeloyl-ACP methyl ester carboxylesterase